RQSRYCQPEVPIQSNVLEPATPGKGHPAAESHAATDCHRLRACANRQSPDLRRPCTPSAASASAVLGHVFSEGGYPLGGPNPTSWGARGRRTFGSDTECCHPVWVPCRETRR